MAGATPTPPNRKGSDGSSRQPLELRMLGGLQVLRGEHAMPQPPSKKTRALLAYLALTRRAHRREALCGMFWDVTDDPRGALRWSLSKLRKQVDDDDVVRLQTDGERVELELRGASIDVLQMRSALGDGALEAAPTALIEHWCGRCTGELLEGLDLADFDAYQAWLIAEREQTRKLHVKALQELVRRSEGEPASALPHARAWIAADPMSLEARLGAMRLALASGQAEEAKRQFQAARRVFSELDPAREGQLVAGWHALRAGPATGSQRPALESEPARPPRARDSTAERRSSELSVRESGSHRVSYPLVGRDRERDELTEALSRVTRKRRAQVVLLTGEPGIGKSRLLDDVLLIARSQGSAVLSGASFEGEAGRPYGPWIDAFRKLPAEQLDASAREKLAPLLEGRDTRASSREALFSGVVEILTRLAATHAPVLIVLDDAHWLDEGSAELLHYTARMQRELALLFVLAARDAELHDQQTLLRVLRSLRRDVEVRDVPLARLPEAATLKLVAQIDRALDASMVFEHSGGNPLFALELARAGGIVDRARTVADAVRDRIARLPPEAGEVLRWCAVLGSSTPAAWLSMVSSLSPEQQLDGLEELERHALLHHELDRGFTFSHEVVRGVVYSDLSQPRRKLMHHRAAEALCQRHEEDHGGELDEELAAQIARHADLGEGHALAARAYITAGKRCLRLFANENAAALARRAMRHARELPEPARSSSMLELLDVQLWARRPDDADQFCRDAQALAETALQHGCVEHARLGFHMISYVRWESGRWDEARIHMLKAEQVMRSGEGKEHVEALADAARCLGLLERDMSHAEAFVNEAKARAGQLGLESAILLDAEGMLKEHRGEIEAADALFERSRQLAENARRHFGEIEALLHRVQLNLDAERYPDALELARAVAQLADRTRDGSEGPFARVLIALAELALGSARPAALHEALEALRAADAKHRLTYGLTRAAMLLNRRALHDAARTVAEEALELSRFLERPSDVVLALVELARAQRALGDQAGWDRSLRQLTERPESRISAHAERARVSLVEEPS